MSVITEGEVLSVRVSPTTNPVVNTVQTDAVLAAPGLNKRYRVYGVSIHFAQPNATGNLTGRCVSGAVDFFALGIAAGQQMADSIMFPQGIPCPVNTAVGFAEACSVISVGYRLTLQYYLESV